jgi:hypothetical protein
VGVCVVGPDRADDRLAAASTLPDGTTRDRFSGVLGFVIALIVSFALSALIQFGDSDGPDLGTQDVRWSVVGPDGEVTHIVWSTAD